MERVALFPGSPFAPTGEPRNEAMEHVGADHLVR